MIKITKSTEPLVLQNKAKSWLSELTQKKNSGEKIRPLVYARFNSNREIKETIIRDSHSKCSYCESKMLNVSHGDIEHIVPLDADHRLAFDWSNLILSCTKCNHGKLHYYSPDDPIINPISDDPSHHLYTEEHWIRATPDTKGPITEEKIKMNRGGLIEERLEQLKNLQDSIVFWVELKKQNNPLKELAKAQILSAQNSESEYLFMKTNHIKKHCLELWQKEEAQLKLSVSLPEE